jgi:hypothetical protein
MPTENQRGDSRTRHDRYPADSRQVLSTPDPSRLKRLQVEPENCDECLMIDFCERASIDRGNSSKQD